MTTPAAQSAAPWPPPGIDWYYADDYAAIACGDCRELLPKMPQVDLVITDPPYGIRKADWDVEFPTWWFDQAALLAPRLGVMPGIWNIVRCPQQAGSLVYRWTLAAHLVNGMTRGCLGYGNWIPCLVYTDDNASAYKTESDIKDFAIGAAAKPDHPSPKPYNVMRWFIERIGGGESVLDPFCGSGTTLRAAKDLGLRSIGIEINEQYAEIAANRLRQEVLWSAMSA